MTVPVVETKADQKPGGDTPPAIEAGSFVSWSGGKGRVDTVVTNGKVPGVDDEVEGSKDSPAARVVVWEKDGDGWKAGGKKIAAMVHTLKRIAPLQAAKSAPGSAGMALISLLAAHEERVEAEGLGASAQVSGAAVKAVWDRGTSAWPGEDTTDLSREEWAEKRVEAFLTVASGTPVEGYTRDLGLLAKTHPLNPANPVDQESKAILNVTPDGDEGVVIVETDDLQAMLDGFRASSTE